MFMQTLCKKGMKMKKAVNTLNLYLLSVIHIFQGVCLIPSFKELR